LIFLFVVLKVPIKDAYSKTCEPKETIIDKIKSLAIRLNSKNSLPRGIQEYLQQKKLILVGEIHGTQEVPKFFGNIAASLVNDKDKTLVILEINQDSQKSIDNFFQTGDESILKRDPFFSRRYQDGRSSESMMKLLKRLSKISNVTVLCMDPMTGVQTMTGQERDTGMATFINSKMNKYGRTLVLSGNIHSSIVIGTPWDKTFRPMGYELKNMVTNLKDDQILNILVRHEKVDSWNCQGAEVSSCLARIGKKFPSDYSTALNWDSYFRIEDALTDGHTGTVFIRSTKVSFPFIRP